MLKKGMLVVGSLLIGGYAATLIASMTSKPPSTLGVHNGRLAPVDASKPNNVSSYEAGAYPKEEPIHYSGDMQTAKFRLMQIMSARPRTKLVEDDGDYLYFTERSLIFRFVDDIEFLFDDDAKVINFRAAARMGYSDMNVNPKRMAEIRRAFEQ